MLLVLAALCAVPSVASAANGWLVQDYSEPGKIQYRWYDARTGTLSSYRVTQAEFNALRARVAYWAQFQSASPPSSALATAGNWTRQQAEAVQTALRTCVTQTQVACSTIRNQAVGLLERAKAWPPFRSLGTLSLAASAFAIGWQIGDWFLGVNAPSPEETSGELEVTGVSAASAGDVIDSLNRPNDPVSMCENQEGNLCRAIAPVPGFYLRAGNRFNEQIGSAGYCTFRFDRGGEGFQPLPFRQYAPSSGSCARDGNALTNQVRFQPADVYTIEPYTGQPTTRTSPGGTPTDEEAKEGAEWCLTSAACAALIPWFIGNDGVQDEFEQAIGISDPTQPPPLLIPYFGDHEDVSSYLQKLEAAGFENVEAVPLPESASDPARGPLEVVRVVPEPGTYVRRDRKIRVRHNSESAPEPSPLPSEDTCVSTEGWEFDFSPLSEPYPNVFPFALFPWALSVFDGVASEAPPPSWDLKLGPDPKAPEMTVSLGEMEPVLDVVRPVIFVVAAVGFVWMLGSVAMGHGRGGDD